MTGRNDSDALHALDLLKLADGNLALLDALGERLLLILIVGSDGLQARRGSALGRRETMAGWRNRADALFNLRGQIRASFAEIGLQRNDRGSGLGV